MSYLLEAEYEQQLVALSQDAELMSLPIGTRSLSQGKVSLSVHTPNLMNAQSQLLFKTEVRLFAKLLLAYKHWGNCCKAHMHTHMVLHLCFLQACRHEGFVAGREQPTSPHLGLHDFISLALL